MVATVSSVGIVRRGTTSPAALGFAFLRQAGATRSKVLSPIFPVCLILEPLPRAFPGAMLAVLDIVLTKGLTMKCYGFWHGGSSYAHADKPEAFDSLADAVATFENRQDNTDYPATPCCDESASMRIAFGSIEECDGDFYPDREITIGPRGGIVVSRC